MQVYVTIAHGRMMRIDENIPATPAKSATLAPILHENGHAGATYRGTTPNNGAAA
jgi:hypothetical protein